jgi:hypothetical protein
MAAFLGEQSRYVHQPAQLNSRVPYHARYQYLGTLDLRPEVFRRARLAYNRNLPPNNARLLSARARGIRLVQSRPGLSSPKFPIIRL